MAFGNRKIEVDIIANDKATRVYDQVASGMNRMSRDFNSNINRINSGLHRYNSAMNSFHRSTQIALAGAGYFIYRFTTDAINQFAYFERQHGKTMGAIASNYKQTAIEQEKFFKDQQRLKDQALSYGTIGPDGKGSFYDPTQVSYAQTALAKAGMKDYEISTVLKPILKFAGGNDLDLDTATMYAVNMGKMFEVPVNQWGNMLDKITRTADLSTLDVEHIFESMKYAGPIAAAQGRDMEEVLAMMAVMGNVGIRGSVAGTGIQAYYTRLLSPIGKSEASMGTAPTEYSKNALQAFVREATDSEGKFRSAVDITTMLDEIMTSLDDREQAWFAHKLFGLFQMKSGLVLANKGSTQLEDIIADIIDNAPGTNERKWDIMMDTSWGRREMFRSVYAGTKTDIGYRLSPITKAIFEELFTFLADKGNYNIDFDKLRESMNEAGELMGEQYGLQLGELTAKLGNMGLSGARIFKANLPLVEGFGLSFAKIISGDLPGGVESLATAISRVNENIDELPPELQMMARQVRNVTTVLATLAGVNFAARILESVTTIYKNTLGKVGTTAITSQVARVNSTTMHVTAGTVHIAGGVVGGGTTPGKGVILGKDGKPISSGKTPGTSTPVPVPSKGQKIGNLANKGFWIYMMSEMFGITDWALDKVGIEQGTTARDVADTARTGAGYAITGHILDEMVLKGAGKRALAQGAGSLLSLGPATLATFGLPILAAGGAVLHDKNRRDKGNELAQQIRELQDSGQNWYYDDKTRKVFTPDFNSLPLSGQTIGPMNKVSSGNNVGGYMGTMNMGELLGRLDNKPPAVNIDMKPKVDVGVNVRVDTMGNILNKNVIVDWTNLDNVVKNYEARIGRGNRVE